MATYSYRVVVDVDINSTGARRGREQNETYLRQVENQIRAHEKRISDDQARFAQARYADKVADFKRQTEAARRNAQDEIEIERRKNQQIASERARMRQQRFQEQQQEVKRQQQLMTDLTTIGRGNTAGRGGNANAQDIRSRQAGAGTVGGAFTPSAGVLGQLNRNLSDTNRLTRQGAESFGMWERAFRGAFVGAVAGMSFSLIISGITGIVQGLGQLAIAAVQAGARFETTTRALEVFAGSAGAAREELRLINEVAQNTAGLRLESAEQGYTRLRALGFQADQARAFIKELGEERILSGASDEALERIIFNFAQIASGGQRVSQELREILTQMPSLRNALFEAFGTLDPKKIQRFFDEDTQGAFKRLTDTMAQQKAAVGGLEDAWGKFQDSLIEAGRAISEPIIPELTEDVRDLTRWIRESADEFRFWGEVIANTYNVLKDMGNFIGNNEGFFSTSTLLGNPLGLPLDAFNAKTGTDIGLIDILSFGTAQYGVNEINRIREMSAQNRARQLFNQATDSGAKNNRGQAEFYAQQELEKTLALSRTLQEADLKKRLDNLDAYYRVETEKAQGNSARVLKLRKEQFTKELDLQNQLFAQRIQGAEGDRLKTAQIENEFSTTLTRMQADYQADVLRIQREGEEKRRQAQLEFNRLTQDEARLSLERRKFEIEQNVRQDAITTQQGFEALTQLSETYYREQRQRLTEQFNLQLQERGLTNEEEANLRKELNLELQRLDFEQLQNTVDIEERKRQEILRTMEFQRQVASEGTSFLSGIAGTFQSSFFNPETFTSRSIDNFRRIALREGRINLARTDWINSTSGVGKATEAFENARRSLPGNLSWSEQAEQLAPLKKAMDEAQAKAAEFAATLNSLESNVPKRWEEFAKLAEQVGVSADAFDKLDAAVLEHLQTLARTEAESELLFWENRLKFAQTDGEKQEARLKIIQSTNRLERLEYDQSIEKLEQYRNSLKGLREENALLEGGDPKALGAIRFLFDKDVAQEQNSLLRQIGETEILISEGDANQVYRQRLEILRHILELRQAEADTVSRMAIADIDAKNQLIFSQRRADADFAEFLTEGKGVTEILSDARINALTTAYNALDNAIGRITKKFGIFGDVIKDVLSNMIRMLSNQLIYRFFFGGQPAAQGGNSGVVGNLSLPQLLNIGGGQGGTTAGVGAATGGTSIIDRLLGAGSTASYNPNAGLLSTETGITLTAIGRDGSLLGTTPGANATTGATGGIGGMFRNLGGAFRGMAPLLGVGIGNMIGGGRGAGGILGSVGGGLLGLVGGAFGSSSTAFGGLFGSIGGFLGISGAATLGIGAAVGGLLMLGSFFLGRNKRRREEEKVRNQAMLDAFRQLDNLIEGVNNDTIDGAQAISQAEQLRSSYLEQMSQLKDKKTRNHALKDVSRIDQKINELKTAVQGQKTRQERLAMSIPTFADGGSLSGWMRGMNYNPLGYQSGGQRLGYFPAAQQVASYNERGSEYIFDAETTKNIGVAELDRIRATKGATYKEMRRKIGVPMMQAGGSVTASVSPSSGSSVAASTGGGQTILLNVSIGLAKEEFIHVAQEVVDANNGSEGQTTKVVANLTGNQSSEGLRKLKRVLDTITT